MKINSLENNRTMNPFKQAKRIMRMTLFFLIAGILFAQASAGYSQGNKLSLNMNAVSIKDACKQIEKETDYIFVFSDNVGNTVNKKVNVAAKAQSIDEVLSNILSGTELNYRVLDKQIVVFREVKKAAPAAPQPEQQKEIPVKGKIVDSHGEPMPGVTIILKGTTRGVTTDINGNFTFNALPGDLGKTLQFSCVGSKSKEAQIAEGKFLNITLEDDVELMEDIVVIGYGSKDKKSLTSSISSLKSDDVERLAATVPSVDAMLGGAIKGVFSTQKSGAPGEGLVINVRGITSPIGSASFTQSNVPLFVIDGMPYFVQDSKLNPLLVISPNDIESIDVLKDASATAIYGSRGANGVVIVKTKNGRKGEKMTIDAGYTFSAANPIKEHVPLNIEEFKQVQDQIIRGTVDYHIKQKGGSIDPSVFETLNAFGKVNGYYDEDAFEQKVTGYDGLREEAFGKNFTNWTDAVKNKNAAAHQYYVSLRGGSETSNYSASINALNQEGLMINDDFSRYGARLSLDSDVSSRIKTGASLSYSVAKRHYGGVSDEVFSSEPHPWRMRPDMPIYDEKGDFMRFKDWAYGGLDFYSPNPVANRNQKNIFSSQQFLGSGYVDVDILEGLRAHAEMNVSQFSNNTQVFIPTLAKPTFFGEADPADASESYSKFTSTSINFRLDYRKKAGDHNFTAMAGVGSERSFYEGRGMSAEGFFNESILHNIGSASIFRPINDSYGKGGLNSAYSRLTYDYAYRYLVEMSFRGDVSSKFGPNNRLATFPAISLGWRINHEPFMENSAWIDDLKLRLSWGKTGSTNVDDFSYLRYYSKGDKYGGKTTVVAESRFPNRNVGWEKTTEYNGGLDFSFFDGKLFGSLDLYSRITKGALSDAPFITESGFGSFTSNLIDMTNKGFELELGSRLIQTKDFSWISTLNISSNSNKVDKLNGANINPYQAEHIIEGQPIGVIKGYKVVGIVNDQKVVDALNAKTIAKYEGTDTEHQEYQKDLGVGDYLLEDIDGDMVITEKDRVILGSPLPKLFGGWNNVFVFNNFELSILSQFSIGGKARYTDLRNDLYATVGQSITRETFNKTWTPENPNALYPRLAYFRFDSYNAALTDRSLFDRSYFRVKTYP